MKKFYILLLFVISIAYNTNVYAQSWTNIKSYEIFGDWVTLQKVTLDSSGNMWVGSWGRGAAKFDGTNWTVYNITNGLISNAVSSIAVDTLGNIWIATSGGVSKFNGTNFTNYTKSSTSNGLVNDAVYNIAVDKKNNIYCGTYKGLSKFNGTTWTVIDGSSYVDALAIDTLNNVWYSNFPYNIYVYNGYSLSSLTKSAGALIDNVVNIITTDNQNNVWFGYYYSYGFSKYNNYSWTNYNTTNSGLTDNKFYSIFVDKYRNKWIGANGKVTKFDGTNWTYYQSNGTDTTIVNGPILSINQDRTGNYWFLSSDYYYGGISIFNPCAPTPAHAITGEFSPCQGQQGVIYSIPVIANATSYFWTLPNGDTITTLTNTISVNFSTSAGNGYIKVQGKNSCGLGSSISKYITLKLLPQPPTTITGETNICTGSAVYSYSADTVSGALAYKWTFNNIGGTNHNGPYYNIIFDSTQVSGYLSLQDSNSCGLSINSASVYINVNHKPYKPESISAPDAICADQQINISVNFSNWDGSIYEWTLPQGITLQWGDSHQTWGVYYVAADAVSGNIVVRAHNDYCGYSDSIFKYIAIRKPIDSVGSIIGPAYVCTSQSDIIFSVPPSNNIDNYSWYFPTWDVSGFSTTDSIALTFSMYSETISVQGHNACGDSPLSSLNVNVLNPMPDPPGWIDGPTDVCFGQSNVVYTVPYVNSATKYIWTLPEGATGASDSNSIVINFGTATGGNISVKAQTICGISTDSSTMSFNIKYKPNKPDYISGADVLCTGNQANYYTNFIGWDFSNYSWTFPHGVTVVDSGMGWVNINYNLDAVSGNVSVRYHNECGFSDSTSMFVTVNHIPDSIYSITGPRNVCQYSSDIYTVPQASNVEYYTWGMPSDNYSWNSNNNINLFIINPGLITVQAHNGCGDSPISSLYVNVMNSIPDQVQTITGLTDVCAGQTNVVYNAYGNNMDTISNALIYIWTFPSGIIDTTYSYSLKTNISENEISGNITVQPVNSCGLNYNYAWISINVNHKPTTPTYFSGTDALCAGNQASYQSDFYGWDMSNYSWTIPQGSTITDGGLDWIGITYSSTAISGNVVFKAHNECGYSDSIFMHVTVNHAPDSIFPIIGPRDICQYAWNTYNAPSASNIDYYTWNLPNGFYGWGQSNSINVGSYDGSGIITVQGHNSCGDSPITPFQVNVLNTAPDAAGTISGLTTVSQSQNDVVYTVPVINNATSYVWTLPNGDVVTTQSDSLIADFTYQSSGNITVKGINPCSEGNASSLFVNVNPSATVNLKIKSSSDTTCQGGSITYTATSSNGGNNPIYNWYVNDVLVSRDSNYIAGLVAYYPFNNNANDESVNSNNGNVNGATLTTDRFGNPNSAYYFGDGNYIKASANKLPTNDRTVSLWFKANSTSTMPTLLGYGGGDFDYSCGQSYMMMLNPCGWSENYFYVQSHCNNNALAYSSPNPISPTTWYHWVVTTEGTVEKMYLNGVLVSINYNFNTPTYVDSKDLSFGVNVSPSGYAPYTDGCAGWFDGAIDDIRIYNNALTDSQVSILYNYIGKSTFTYTPSNNDQIKCVVTSNQTTDPNATSNIITMTVNPPPGAAGNISGLTTVNQGQNNVTYTVPSIDNVTSYVWTLPNGVSGTSSTNTISVNFDNTFQSGNISVKGNNRCGDGNITSLSINSNYPSKTLQVTAMLQGYYDYVDNNNMIFQAQDVDQDGNSLNKWSGNKADTLSVLIRSTIAPDYIIEQEYPNSYINTDGTITLSGTIPNNLTGYHYIVLKHWKSIETWSDSTDFTDNTITYNFYTNPPSTQFPNNMTDNVSGNPANGLLIWAGDITDGNGGVGIQDGYVTLDDMFMVYDANLIVLSGYEVLDINGDGYVTLDDMFLVYDNNLVVAQVVNPITLNSKKK